jgi:hypothetical protein
MGTDTTRIRWGQASIDDVSKRVSELLVRIVESDQGYGSLVITVTPDKLDIEAKSVLRVGSNRQG